MPVQMQPTSVIKANLGLEPNGRVQRFFTNTCAKHMDKYVPFDRGILAKYHIEQGNLIVYDQIYARYQYEGISKSGKPLNYQKVKHPFATSYWDKKMWSAERDTIVKEVQNYIGRS